MQIIEVRWRNREFKIYVLKSGSWIRRADVVTVSSLESTRAVVSKLRSMGATVKKMPEIIRRTQLGTATLFVNVSALLAEDEIDLDWFSAAYAIKKALPRKKNKIVLKLKKRKRVTDITEEIATRDAAISLTLMNPDSQSEVSQITYPLQFTADYVQKLLNIDT